tara:strand:- start:458 stop:838 length:381 start_codon:yes stop_codon:yes gene_type:complete
MKNNFQIKSEADCERVAKVFVNWLKNKSPQLNKRQIIKAPSEMWAHYFSDIYTDELLNNHLEETAEKNIIHVEFNIINPNKTGLENIKDSDLMSLLQEFLDNMEKHEEEPYEFNDDDFDLESEDNE